jgi:HSP20 family molecular chaperone IbpA
MRVSPIDLFEPFKLLNDFESSRSRYRFDSIDEEGIKIELPGVKPEDLNVTVDGKTLKVTGKSRHGKEFSYAYTLKSSVDDAGISAHLQDGLLSISLPKKAESSVRKIAVTT